MRSKETKKGFTLVELIIAIGIFAFVVGTSYTFMHSSTIFVNKGINNVNKQNDIRLAVEWITKDLKSSDKVTKFNAGSILYSVEEKGSKIEYIREELGEIKGEKVYKIYRQDSKDKFVLIENIPELGFKIESLENLFDVTITHKDKFNKDRITNFKVSTKKNIALVEPPKPITKTDTPTIDTPLFEGERTISGTAEPNSSITIRRNGNIIGRGTTDSSGEYIVTLDSTLQRNDVITVTALSTGKTESDPATATVIFGENMITASPLVLKESSSNDGSLENNKITAVLNWGAGNFDNKISKSDVIISGLPDGMDFTVYRTDSKELTITLTGKAINHSDSDDVDMIIIVKRTGFTGNSSHGKDGYSNVVSIDFIDKTNWGDFVVLTQKLYIDGSSLIDAPNSTVIVKGDANNEVKISGGDKHINAKNIYINQKLVLTSGAKIGNENKSSSIYANGIVDVDLNGTAYIYGKLYHTKELKVNQVGSLGSIDSAKVSTIEFPISKIPTLETDQWYKTNGWKYEDKDRSPQDGLKFLSSTTYDFKNDRGSGNYGSVFDNVNIVSKSGDIIIPEYFQVSGILFAPNGKVYISGSSKFTGIIVAKEVELTGHVKVYSQRFNLKDLPFKY